MNKSVKFWDRLSSYYDAQAKDKAYKLTIKKSEKYLKPNDRILDFGCATGLYSIKFANRVREIQAFDISSRMIDIAKRKALDNKIYNVSFIQTTLFDERYKEYSFDVILAFNILLYFDDVEQVLERMKLLLKEDGIIICSTACLKEKRMFIGILSSSFIFILKKLKILPYLKFFTVNELEDTIAICGFKIIETEVLIDNPATEYYIVAKNMTSH